MLREFLCDFTTFCGRVLNVHCFQVHFFKVNSLTWLLGRSSEIIDMKKALKKLKALCKWETIIIFFNLKVLLLKGNAS
jgi:hypothetical protein